MYAEVVKRLGMNFTLQFLMFLLVPTVSSGFVRTLSQKKANVGKRFRGFFYYSVVQFCICWGGVLCSFGYFVFWSAYSPLLPSKIQSVLFRSQQ